MKKVMVFIGTWSRPIAPAGKKKPDHGGEGVYSFEFDAATGSLVPINVVPSVDAGILAVSPDGKYVYAANECRDFCGLIGSGGGVTAFSVNPLDGSLSKINDSPAYGACTAYVTVSKSGKYLLAANHGSHFDVTCNYVPDGDGGWKLERGYDDASIAVFRLRDDGGIDKLTDLQQFHGHGYYTHGLGQSTCHIHSVNINENNLVVGCNRGADRLEIFHLNEETGKLELLESHHYFRHGLAPRHAIFHPTLDLFYVCNENYPCVTVWKYDEKACQAKELQFLGTVPQEKLEESPIPLLLEDVIPNPLEGHPISKHENTPADVRIHPAGKFLYVSNRHPGTIGVFSVDENGLLHWVGSKALEDTNPRGFQISPDGAYAIVGLMDTGRVAVYPINQETGMLADAVSMISVPSPCSVRCTLL